MDGVIAADDPRAEDVRALLATHLALGRANCPPEDVHALEPEGLLDPAIRFFSARRDGRLLGVGALRRLDAEHAEIKAMHVDAAARGSGVGRAMLEHLLALARASGFRRVSLETGTMAAFEAARALYASVGFAPCPPFGHYRASPSNVYMTLALDASGER